MNQHSAETYLAAKYAVLFRELSPEEGGGFVAMIPQLGWRTFVAEGESLEEALDALEVLKQILIPNLLAEGVDLPLPVGESTWMDGTVRIPQSLQEEIQAVTLARRIPYEQFVHELLKEGLRHL